MIEITLEFLEKKKACEEGLYWFKNQTKTDINDVIQSLMAENRFCWANWLICRVLDKIACVQYAVNAAEQVIGIWAKEYPDDNRPQKAIDAAKTYSRNPNDYAAADAAVRAADSAAYVVYAAYAADAAVRAADAAADAARAAYAAKAAYVADAAADAARAAKAAYVADAAASYVADAAYAADAADAAEIKQKIIDFGLALIKGDE